jgi:hypothetical protein
MNNRINPKNQPWFPFYAAAFLGSDTVISMTMTECGIYIKLIAMCWLYGSIPWDSKLLAKKLVIDKRTVVAFMEKYGRLIGDLSEPSGNLLGNIRQVTFPKLQEFALTLGKNAPEKTQKRREEKRGEEKRGEQISSVLSSFPLDTKTTTKAKTDSVSDSVSVSVPDKATFDPLTFENEVTSVKGDKLTYPPHKVKRSLQFHFKARPSDFWSERIRSVDDLARHIDTMYKQMVDAVGENWTPPAAKAPQTRMAGDPACLRCRGYGSYSKRLKDSVVKISEPCTCTKHEQILLNGEWVATAGTVPVAGEV